jgi:hypothetical protein
LAALLGALMLSAHPAALRDFALDDAWIHLVYARSLWEQGSFAYNPGQVETGFTSPLWVMVLAPVVGLSKATGIGLVLLVKVVGALLSAVTAWLLARHAARLAGERAGWLTLVAAGASPLVAFGSVSGMEVPLAAAMVSLALTLGLTGGGWPAGVALALAALARPELAVAGMLVFVWGLSTCAAADRLRLALALALPSALAGGAWLAGNLAATGHALPSTFYAKSDASMAAGLQHLVRQVVVGWGAERLVVAVPAAVAGAWRLWRLGRADAALWLGVAIATPLAITATAEQAPHVEFYMSRYFAPTLVLWAPVVGLGLDAAAARLRRAWAGAAAGAALALAATPALLGAADAYGRHCRDIELLHTGPFAALASSVDATTVVAVEGAGASRWLLPGPVLDLVGLNDHVRVHLREGRAQMCHVALAGPTWLVVPDDWLPRFTAAFDVTPVSQVTQPVWSVVGGTGPRTVVTARIAPKPGLLAFCQEKP